MALNVKDQLRQFLAEDIGRGDITSSLLTGGIIQARIIAREDAVVAGTKFAKMIFELKGCRVRILEQDGTTTRQDLPIMSITGDARDVLACERTALNLLARMSGIATQTRQLASNLPEDTELYATRKTAPGLRYFDKIAVEIGGGHRHRMRLDEMVMIKDNHVAAEGSLESLIRKAKRRRRRFEVEVDDGASAVLAAREGATIIMLDNFTPVQIKKTIQNLKKRGLRDGVILEASGGISHNNIAEFGKTGVDVISVGSITSSVRGVDMSLEV